ncbi:Dipeptidyl peptidase 2 [Desmophyllum pertusum]|uniref:Dipeptidyl peptidase 2 n=1 Tax=Desmophyllum pertusum TaxID=174260 RepID=A0A9W9YUS0_9CNID|nr:Dipeptidyl peptidase 2 [Desmophyllum pertusum]
MEDVSYGDELWHVVLYQWLIDNALTDRLLEIHHLLGWIRNAFTNLAMGDYTYPTTFLAPLPGYPVNVACKMMATASSKLQGLADVTAMVYNGTNGTLTCLDPDTEYIECADPTGCGLGPDSRALDYQVCSELALPVAGSNNKTDMFPPQPWTPDMIAKYCQEKWGVTKRPSWITTQLWGKGWFGRLKSL